MSSSSFAPKPEEIECIRTLFHAIAASSGNGSETKHLKANDLADLCLALNDPIPNSDEVATMLSDTAGLITFEKFIDFWSSEDDLYMCTIKGSDGST